MFFGQSENWRRFGQPGPAPVPPPPRPQSNAARAIENVYGRSPVEHGTAPPAPDLEIYTVEVTNPDGSREELDIEGPAGMSDGDIQQLLAGQMGGQQQTRPYNPAAAWGESGMRGATGFLQGVAEIGDNAAEIAQNAWNATGGRLTGLTSDSATRANQGRRGGVAGLINPDAPRGGFQGLTDQLPEGNALGRTAGNIAGTYLLTRGLGPGGQGAGAGALMSDAETPGQFAGDVATGYIGGRIAEPLVRGAQYVLAPVRDRAAQLLHSIGVRLTPGQYLPALREFEDKAASWPFVGPMLQRQRREGAEDFARAIPTQALDTARRAMPGRNIAPMEQGVTGQQAVRRAGDELSRIYNDVIPQLRLQVDDELAAGIAAVRDNLATQALTPAGQRQFERIVRDGVMGRLGGRVATGQQYQATDTFLEQQAARFGRSADPNHQAIAESVRDIRAELRNAIQRQNGELGEQLAVADEAWSMLVPAEQAAAGAPRGFFTPAQYRQALARGDSRVRRRGMARGEVRGQDIAEAGQDVLSSQHPNFSGTSSHEAYNIGNARFWQGLAARGLYGPGTQNALGRLTINRPPAFDPVAEAVARSLNYLPSSQAGGLGANALTNSLFGF